MATITLKYNARNSKATKMIDAILSLGLFTEKKKNAIDEAEDDIKKGRVYTAKSAKDLYDKLMKD